MVRLIFARTLELNKFRITIDDGVTEYKIDPKKELAWNGELHSPLGYVQIDYPNSDTTVITQKVFFKKG
ncbi:hypothetical protein, partial [Niastella vici]|uniref:hypothetical protein n=1 Tax=Niastella vici TaxID=1703345 RepID=UPI00117C6A31